MNYFTITKQSVLSTIVFILMAFQLNQAVANPTPPDEVVKTTLQKALAELEENRAEFAADSKKLDKAINDILGPAINFELFSKGVLGKHRRDITPQQFDAFVAEFKRLLIGTYASTVFEYSGQKINYLPFSNPKNKDRVKVVAEFLTQSGGKIPMTFSMNIRDDTKWRVYNIKVQTPDATIELIPLFRTDYSDRISKVGIDKLIEEMREINNS